MYVTRVLLTVTIISIYQMW